MQIILSSLLHVYKSIAFEIIKQQKTNVIIVDLNFFFYKIFYFLHVDREFLDFVTSDLFSGRYCTVAYTSVTFYKLQVQHGQVYLAGLYVSQCQWPGKNPPRMTAEWPKAGKGGSPWVKGCGNLVHIITFIWGVPGLEGLREVKGG